MKADAKVTRLASYRRSRALGKTRRAAWLFLLAASIFGYASGPVAATFAQRMLSAPPAATGSGCQVTGITDGDTVDMRCPGRGEERVRLTGFDTPELFSPKCSSERRAAQRAKAALEQHIHAADSLMIVRRGTDRYGRTLADMHLDGRSVAGLMIAEGHARAYDGGQRRSWC